MQYRRSGRTGLSPDFWAPTNPRAVPVVRISAVNEKDDIIVKVEITNRGSSPYRLLERDLPTDGLMTKTMFWVYRDDQEIRYTGMAIDRQITESVYLTVDAGCRCTTTIGLAQHYDVTPKGMYRIQYNAAVERVGGDGERVYWLKSNVIVAHRK